MDKSYFDPNSTIKIIGCNTATPGNAGQPCLALEVTIKTGISTLEYIGPKDFVLNKPEQWLVFIPLP